MVDGVVASRRYFDLAPISECLPFQGRSGDDLDPFLPKLLGVETNRGEWKEPPIRGTNPRADNPRVMLTPKRPSEHDIGSESFLSDNGGAIPASVLQFTNTRSGDTYLNYCKARNLKLHPARMPIGLAEFFIKFLTTPKNLVLDPFGGSNVTGAAAEALKRRWIAIEADRHYIDGSRGRFESMPEVKVYDH